MTMYMFTILVTVLAFSPVTTGTLFAVDTGQQRPSEIGDVSIDVPGVGQPSLPMNPASYSGSALTTVWGPEVFRRERGKPATFVRPVSIADSVGPYVLHVRNGDGQGGNRVSSAHVLLGGQLVFGPSAFSAAVDELEAVVVPSIGSAIEIQLEAAPDGQLTIWLAGRSSKQLPHEFVVIGPNGGDHLFSSGISLHVPAGAVREPTTIGMSLSERLLVEPIMLSYGLRSKYFVAGFDALPHGLEFLQPVSVTLPGRPVRDSADLPVYFRACPIAIAVQPHRSLSRQLIRT